MSKEKLALEDLEKIDLDRLHIKDRIQIQKLINELKNRKQYFPLLDFKLQNHQEEIMNAVAQRNIWNIPLYKYIMFIWWNGSWKSIWSVYVDILLALWKSWCEKYNLPYIWEAKQILVVTKTSDSIKTNLEPYFLWTTNSIDDKIKIPPQEIEKVKRDWSTQALKEIILKNWNKILFRTYDAWQARLEWSNPDFIHLDELPERSDIFIELLRGTRWEKTQMLLSFTPTKFNPAVYDYFYWQRSENVKSKTFIREVDSLENKYADHTWLEWLSEEEQKIRRFWMFVPPTWLVYWEFSRWRNLIDFINPRELWWWVKYYWALDFWVNHPMAFLLIAVDEDWHIYVFDMIYQKKMLLWELATKIRNLKSDYWIELEYIVADTADARSRLELKTLHWIDTVPANKWEKWESNISNRRAWIFKINELFKNSMILISNKCKDLVKELETHAYKWDWSENVIKTDDDACDALRYFIFSYNPHSEKRILNKKLRQLRNSKINKNRY